MNENRLETFPLHFYVVRVILSGCRCSFFCYKNDTFLKIKNLRWKSRVFEKVFVVSSIFFLPYSSFLRTFPFSLQYHISCHLLFLITSSVSINGKLDDEDDDDDVQCGTTYTHTWIGDKWDCYYNEVISFLDIFLFIWQRDINQYIRYHLYFLHPASTRHLNRQANNVQYVCVCVCGWMKVVNEKENKTRKRTLTHAQILHIFTSI